MFLLVCFSNRNISFSLIVQSKKKVGFEDVDNAKKTNKAEPASKQSIMQLVLKASNNLYWFSSIFSFWRQQQLMFYVFFKVSAEPSSLQNQSGDKSKGAPSKDDDKGAKDDDKASKDDDKASKDDGSIRDDGKQGKHTFFISPAAIFVSAFLVEPATWIELFSNL